MSFNILALRTSDDSDGTIWPMLARAPGGFLTEAEPGDGQGVVCTPVAAVSVGAVTDSGIRRVISLGDLTAWTYVTDSRVIFAASKFDKGSSWSGWGLIGLTVAVAATGISKARAASRSRARSSPGRFATLGCARRARASGMAARGGPDTAWLRHARAGDAPRLVRLGHAPALGDRQPARRGSGHRPPLRGLPAEELSAARRLQARQAHRTGVGDAGAARLDRQVHHRADARLLLRRGSHRLPGRTAG